MMLENVKYWTVMKGGVDWSTAIHALKTQTINGSPNKNVAIRRGYNIILPNAKLNELRFSIEELESDKWEIVVPDNHKEELLETTRDLVRDANFLNTRYNRIDHMDISDIWNAIDDVIVCLDDNAKYKLIKYVVENKLYKKS